MAANAWHRDPLQPPEAPWIPSPWPILYQAVSATFRKVLVYEHAGMADEAEAARRECAECVRRLRARFDPDPMLGPEVADAVIAWCVRQGRERFGKDLAGEGRRRGMSS